MGHEPQRPIHWRSLSPFRRSWQTTGPSGREDQQQPDHTGGYALLLVTRTAPGPTEGTTQSSTRIVSSRTSAPMTRNARSTGWSGLASEQISSTVPGHNCANSTSVRDG